MYNLKLNNLDNGSLINFSPTYNWWITEAEGMDALGIELSESQGINQVGTTVLGQSVPSRLITITGTVSGEAALYREQLVRTMPPMSNLRLTFDNSLYIDGYPEGTPEYQRYYRNMEFRFSIRCPYPYWRYTGQEVTELSGMEAMFSFPVNYSDPEYHVFGQRIDEAYKNIDNTGNVPCPFKVTLNAVTALSNPQIIDIETLRYIRIQKDMVAGETITIDATGHMLKITDNIGGVETNAFKYFDTSSTIPFLLNPGQNLIRYDADTNRSGLNATIHPAFALSSAFGNDNVFA